MHLYIICEICISNVNFSIFSYWHQSHINKSEMLAFNIYICEESTLWGVKMYLLLLFEYVSYSWVEQHVKNKKNISKCGPEKKHFFTFSVVEILETTTNSVHAYSTLCSICLWQLKGGPKKTVSTITATLASEKYLRYWKISYCCISYSLLVL